MSAAEMRRKTLVRCLKNNIVVRTDSKGQHYFYVGRKAPKGWRETGKAMHLGKGMWLLHVEPAR